MRFTKFHDAILGIFQTLNSFYPNRPTVGNPTKDVERSGHYNPPTVDCKPAARPAGTAMRLEQLTRQRGSHAPGVSYLESDCYTGIAGASASIRCKKSKYQVHISQSTAVRPSLYLSWPANCCSIKRNGVTPNRNTAAMATTRFNKVANWRALGNLPGEL